MLEVVDGVTGYGKAMALRGVSCTVATGSVLGVIGANGAGKTTLMSVIAGALPLWSGEVRFQGKDISKVSAVERTALGLALCPEGRHILSTLSVEENLKVGATALLEKTERRKRKGVLAERLEFAYGLFPVLKERRGSSGGALSGGQQQMLAIGRALMSRPTLLLLDEPSLGLAPVLIEEVYEMLGLLRSEGLTLVLVEESSARALEFAEQAIVMKHGQVFLQGSAAQVKADPNLSAAYLGEGDL
jgi:branched-chain amino acid transport system ATP-binding protein